MGEEIASDAEATHSNNQLMTNRNVLVADTNENDGVARRANVTRHNVVALERPATDSAPSLSGLRVLVVHEWLYSWAGAERVLEQIVDVFPQADLLVGVMTERMRGYNAVTRRAKETWVGGVPGARTHHRPFLPLHALAFETYDTSKYDLVISESHAFEKCIRATSNAVHLCYCHSPPRFVWDLQHVYAAQAGPIARLALNASAPLLRAIDRRGARRVDRFVVNSRNVAERVRRSYGRDADVVYPPVVAKHGASDATADTTAASPFLLHLGRLVPYKRLDLVVAAAERLQIPLVVAGDGPERPRLERLAGKYTELLGEVSEARAAELLSSCSALVFAGEEDFGIVLVEANAHGKPVVCYAAGGAVESMVADVTATFFERQDVESLAGAITRCLGRTWDERALHANAARFAPENFRRGFRAAVARALAEKPAR